ncbi:hypothetical protein HK098_004365 [Nowakowskiella sp. JEL0407]|nr:hypothetical protein HK098_004365 [Nowakowskiella sp. JEL0407]
MDTTIIHSTMTFSNNTSPTVTSPTKPEEISTQSSPKLEPAAMEIIETQDEVESDSDNTDVGSVGNPNSIENPNVVNSANSNSPTAVATELNDLNQPSPPSSPVAELCESNASEDGSKPPKGKTARGVAKKKKAPKVPRSTQSRANKSTKTKQSTKVLDGKLFLGYRQAKFKLGLIIYIFLAESLRREKLKMRAMAFVSEIEDTLSLFRTKRCEEKMHKIDQEMETVKNGTHPEYQAKIQNLEEKYRLRRLIAEKKMKMKEQSIVNMFAYDALAIANDQIHQRADARRNQIQEVSSKIFQLQHEKRKLDVDYSQESTKSLSKERKIKRRNARESLELLEFGGFPSAVVSSASQAEVDDDLVLLGLLPKKQKLNEEADEAMNELPQNVNQDMLPADFSQHNTIQDLAGMSFLSSIAQQYPSESDSNKQSSGMELSNHNSAISGRTQLPPLHTSPQMRSIMSYPVLGQPSSRYTASFAPQSFPLIAQNFQNQYNNPRPMNGFSSQQSNHSSYVGNSNSVVSMYSSPPTAYTTNYISQQTNHVIGAQHRVSPHLNIPSSPIPSIPNPTPETSSPHVSTLPSLPSFSNISNSNGTAVSTISTETTEANVHINGSFRLSSTESMTTLYDPTHIMQNGQKYTVDARVTITDSNKRYQARIIKITGIEVTLERTDGSKTKLSRDMIEKGKVMFSLQSM